MIVSCVLKSNFYLKKLCGMVAEVPAVSVTADCIKILIILPMAVTLFLLERRK